jgi:DNA-binding transcriptional LysR family regulator
MNKLRAMSAFRRVAELGSFTGAAQDLGLSNAAVSNYVSQLEADLGVTLLLRSTRHVGLSEIGKAYLPKVQAILDAIEEAEDTARGLQTTPHGRLHVNAPATFGLLHVSPFVPDFARRYPAVTLDLSFNDRIIDLIEDRVDIALRISRGLPDSTLVARVLKPIRRAVCASPDYLARRGAPETPANLAQHDCITYTLSDSAQDWSLGGVRYPIAGKVRADSSIAVRDLTLAGLGISMMPRFIAGPDLHAGRLVSLLDDHPTEDLTLHAVFPPGTRPSVKLRAFVGEFLSFLGDPPRWENAA